MKCDVCRRRDAAAVITMIVNGKNGVRHVCSQCIKKLQRGDAFAAEMAILSTMDSVKDQAACPVCGTTPDDIRRTGRVGCASCYHFFFDMLQPLVIRMNGAMQRREEEMNKQEPMTHKSQIDQLREQMFSAVNAENYERAAELRDEIRRLEREGGEEKA